MQDYWLIIVMGTLMGFLARLLFLRVDYRQYPSYPHGYVTHLALGFIAASLGAVAVRAFVEREFTAVTFLALAAQQFRDIRSMERDALVALEDTELVPRGNDYIENIARIFEARNYLAMLTAFVTSCVLQFAPLGPTYKLAMAILAGFACIIFVGRILHWKRIGDIAQVVPFQLKFEGPSLFVDDVYITNVAIPEHREFISKYGLGVLIKPKNDNARAILANVGQRKAIIHDCAAILGIRKDYHTPEFTPIAKRDLDTGKVGMAIVPMEPDMDSLLAIIRRVTVLESTKKMPLQTKAGRIASD